MPGCNLASNHATIYLPQRGLTGFVRLWLLTRTGLGPGLLPLRTSRGLHFAIATPPFHVTNWLLSRMLRHDSPIKHKKEDYFCTQALLFYNNTI